MSLFAGGDHSSGFKVKLALQFFQRRRCSKGLHADDLANKTDIAAANRVIQFCKPI